jgi:hypothetical protein
VVEAAHKTGRAVSLHDKKVRMKTTVPRLLLILLIWLGILTGCISREPITEEFVGCLVQTNAGTMDRLGSELKIIDQNLYTTEEKLLKLEQVISPAVQWIENQKVKLLEEHQYGSWHSRMARESLAEFKNDRYELTAVEITVYDIGAPNQKFDTVIRVADLETKTLSDCETLYSELKWRKSTLEEGRQTKLEEGHLAASTLNSVIDHLGDWEIREVNSTTYSVSGPGLGMDGELTAGKWTYYRAFKEIMPADAQSSALQKILSAGL